jgi:NtrC-family two-component system response regulator AlgB
MSALSAAPSPSLVEAAPWSALVVDDDPGVRQSIRLCLEAAGARVLGVGGVSAALEALERSDYDVVFLDLWLGSTSGLDALPEVLRRRADVQVVVVTAFATYESAVEAMRRGAADYLPKPFTPEQVRHAAGRVLEARRLRQRVRELEERLATTDLEISFESQSAEYRIFLRTAERAAGSEGVVLLRGESGTGKNVLAHWMRDRSPRRDRPFVAVNCPALGGDLMVSTLFGHKRGAFTGAVTDEPGKVQEAAGGTLFLDEVGELAADAQARLLRFLNDQRYERVGEARERRADVRLIAATNRDLAADVAAGRFREDLFYRLDVLTLIVPPLRNRREDVLPLARRFLAFFAVRQDRQGLAFSTAAEAALTSYDWPGNLRELRNAVERAVILTPQGQIVPADLGIPAAGAEGAARPGAVAVGELVSLDGLEREHIAQVVARTPTLEAAARVLGIDPTTLQRKRRRYDLV